LIFGDIRICDPIRISTTVIEDGEEDENQEEENKDDYIMMAVDWLEKEPNFLYSELSSM